MRELGKKKSSKNSGYILTGVTLEKGETHEYEKNLERGEVADFLSIKRGLKKNKVKTNLRKTMERRMSYGNPGGKTGK